MKKFLSIMLAVLMITSIFATAIPVLAAGNADSSTGTFKIGTAYYTDLKSALTDAKAGDTIEMLTDVTDNATEILATVKVNLTIEGNGYTYTAPKNTNRCIFAIQDNANVTIKNMEVNSQSGINVQKGTLNITDCTFTISHRTAVKSDAATVAVVNVHNSLLQNTVNNEQGEQGEPIILLNATTSNTLNITGTSELKKNTKTGGVGNGSVINVGGNAQNTTINLAAGAALTINQSTTTVAAAGGIHAGTNNPTVINLAKGSIIKSTTQLAEVRALSGNANGVTIINDEGCKFLVNDNNTNFQKSFSIDNVSYKMTMLEETTVDGFDQYALSQTTTTAKYSVELFNGQVGLANTLKNALLGVKNNGTITLNDNDTTTDTGLTSTKNLTVNLNGKTLTATGAGYFFSSIKGAFTFKNGKVVVARGFCVNDTGILTFEDVTGGVVPTDAGARPFIKLTAGGKSTATFIRSQLSTKSAGEPFINIEGGTTGTVNVKDGSTLTFAGVKGGAQHNNGIFSAQGTNTSVTVNVDATSTLAAAGSGNYAYIFMADKNAKALTANIADGATLSLGGTAGLTDFQFIYADDTNQNKIAVNGTGANIVVDENVAAKGVALPKFTLKSGETLVGYANGGKIYNALTVAGNYKVVTYTTDDFAMQDGAALRTVWQENGIRFTTEISADLYNAIKDNAVFGTVIAPNVEGANPNEYEGDKLDIVATKTQTVGDKVLIRAAVLMPETVEAYKLQLAANAYFTVTYADGTTATFNTAFGTENVRSMFDVATNLKAQGYTDAAVEAILTACAE